MEWVRCQSRMEHCIKISRAHAQGVKQSARKSSEGAGTQTRVLGVCACYKHNQSVDIGEKLVCTGFELLKKAY